MAKKILDFTTDQTKSDDYVLVTNDHDGTRKVKVPNLQFKYINFSGTTDKNGLVSTMLDISTNHPISIYVPDTLSYYYPDTTKHLFAVKVSDNNNQPIVGKSVSGTLYYVKD